MAVHGLESDKMKDALNKGNLGTFMKVGESSC